MYLLTEVLVLGEAASALVYNAENYFIKILIVNYQNMTTTMIIPCPNTLESFKKSTALSNECMLDTGI